MDSDAYLTSETSAIKGANNNARDLDLARENGQLRRELEAMTRQRDILKKAISIFSEDKIMSGAARTPSGGLK